MQGRGETVLVILLRLRLASRTGEEAVVMGGDGAEAVEEVVVVDGDGEEGEVGGGNGVVVDSQNLADATVGEGKM